MFKYFHKKVTYFVYTVTLSACLIKILGTKQVNIFKLNFHLFLFVKNHIFNKNFIID